MRSGGGNALITQYNKPGLQHGRGKLPQFARRHERKDASLRQIAWLHVSDIHMQERDSWSQDVVLGALLASVRAQIGAGRTFDFALLTGDLAYSGKTGEYALVAEFIAELAVAADVPMERIFCVPGNHDIDRTRQKLCFAGARATLREQSHVDELLAGGEELATLLLREGAYRSFIKSSFPTQQREVTPQSLAYVSRMRIDDIEVAILGLDSSWLAHGGLDDHGKLLIGERQVIDVINIALAAPLPPHLLIAISHHPLHLLQEFDRLPAQHRIEQVCHFYQCGHLHEPEVRSVGHSGKSCLTIAAGATFETRKSQNVYSVITVDLAEAARSVEIAQYQPKQGRFVNLPASTYAMDLAPAHQCDLSELASAIGSVFSGCAPLSHYFAALILGIKSEFPIERPHGVEFGSIDLIRSEPPSELRAAALRFFKFRNVLGLFYGRVELSVLIGRHGAPLRQLGELLNRLATDDEALKARLSEYERGSIALYARKAPENDTYTQELLLELAAAEDWPLLRQHSARHLDSVKHDTSVLARRLLALSLSHSTDLGEIAKAADLLRVLLSSGDRSISDACIMASLLFNSGQVQEARSIVFAAIRDFDPANDALVEIGQRIVAATGDKELRDALRAVRLGGSS
jgi:hypothetical protein